MIMSVVASAAALSLELRLAHSGEDGLPEETSVISLQRSKQHYALATARPSWISSRDEIYSLP